MKYIIRNKENQLILKLNDTPTYPYSGTFQFSFEHLQTNAIVTLILDDESDNKISYQKFTITSGDSLNFQTGQYLVKVYDLSGSTFISSFDLEANNPTTDDNVYFLANSNTAYVYDMGSTAIPDKPVGFSSILNGTSAELSWDKGSPNTDSFDLWRKDGQGNYFNLNTEIESLSYLDLNLNEGDAYYYKLRGENEIGFSQFTNEIEVNIPITGNTGTSYVTIIGSGGTTATETSQNVWNIYSVTGGTAEWGNITGNVQNQTDLQLELDAKVDLSGDTMTGGLSTPYLTLPASTFINEHGRLQHDIDEQTLSFGLDDGGSLQIGKEVFEYYTNMSGGDLIEGDVVSIVGVSGNRQAVNLTDATNSQSTSSTIGMVTSSGATNQKIRVTLIGKVNELNTDTYTEGLPIYVDPLNAGKWTQTPPEVPNGFIHVGIVEVSHAVVGVVNVGVRISPTLTNLSDVDGTPLDSSGQIPVWDNDRKVFDFTENTNNFLTLTGASNNYVPISGGTMTGKLTVDADTTTYSVDINQVNDPTVAPTGVAIAGSGLEIGNYKYYVAYITDMGQTHMSPQSLTITTTSGNQAITLTIPISDDPRVTSRKLYRGKVNQTNYFQEYDLTIINDNTTTVFVDTIPDVDLTNYQYGLNAINSTTPFITVNDNKRMLIDENATIIGTDTGTNMVKWGATVLIGGNAGRDLTTGVANTLIGGNAGANIETGGSNVAVGGFAMGGGVAASNNVAIGGYAVYNNSGSYNVGIGQSTFEGMTSGSKNTALGAYSGDYYGSTGTAKIISASDSLFLGAYARAAASTSYHEIVIGACAIGQGSYTTTIGDSGNTTNTYINGVDESKTSHVMHYNDVTNEITYAEQDLSQYVVKTGDTMTGNLVVSGDTTIGGDFRLDNTQWDDLKFPVTTLRQGATNKPDFDDTEIGYLMPQNDETEILYMSGQFSHSYKTGTDILPHVHYMQSSATVAQFTMSYRWYDNGKATGAWTDIDTSVTPAFTYTGGTILQIVEFPSISGATVTGVSSMIDIKLWRKTGDGVSGDVLLKEVDIHYEKNRLGSDNEYTNN